MIRPANFGYNPETAVNNAFQTESKKSEEESIQARATKEFDNMVELIRDAGVEVLVWNDSVTPIKPDAVFPNNWFSTNPDGALITYPMFAKNRRIERDSAIVDYVESLFIVDRRYTLEHYEEADQFLEGTGSLMFDYDEKVIYACLSPRTNIQLIDKIAVLGGFRMMVFHAVDANGDDIYHTNVMMALTSHAAIVCLASVKKEEEKDRLISSIKASNRVVVDITFDQMNAFAGNMIQLVDQHGDPVLVMSKQAYDSLTKAQVKLLSEHHRIVAPDIKTIETFGGGSARCMIAEIFLEKRVALT